MFSRVGGVIGIVGLITTLVSTLPVTIRAAEAGARVFGIRPDGTRIGIRSPDPLRGRFQIQYHNGPVMLGGTNVYFIWYGTWDGHPAQELLTHFASNLGGTPYHNINTLYPDAVGSRPSNAVTYGGAIDDLYSQGASLSKAAVQAVVARAIDLMQLPLDPSGIYFVLGSADVTISGFCTAYCGLRDHFAPQGTPVNYAFIGNPERCPNQCAPQQRVSPNLSIGGDAMASIMANLISTATTDPRFTAWYDLLGFENADKCAWTYGKTYKTPNGARANVRLGNRDYLLQQNWVPTPRGGFCALGANP